MIIFGVFVWPFWNLMPTYVTEQVKRIYVDDQGLCIAQSPDNYLVPIGKCDSQPRDLVVAKYDVKIKERMVQSIRRL